MTDKVVGQPSSGNLFESLPKQQAEEEFEILLNHPNVRIERIVSTGSAVHLVFGMTIRMLSGFC